jgi:hypothetical protein
VTDDQYHLCQLLHRCRYLPATFEKRFARSMQTCAREQELTEKQVAQLLRQAYRYRQQLRALIMSYTQDVVLQERLRCVVLAVSREEKRGEAGRTQ